MTKEDRAALKMYVSSRNELLKIRVKFDNRLGRKADGKAQEGIESREIPLDALEFVTDSTDMIGKQIRQFDKKIKDLLKTTPIYTDYLEHIPGISFVSAAKLLSTIDIHKATNPSKIWQYAGYNPSEVKGTKRIQASKYRKTKMGPIVKEVSNPKTGGAEVIYQTDTMIRGDKLTPGFLSPYNTKLRVDLRVIADCFLRNKNNYYQEYYLPKKEEYLAREWTKMHAHQAAIRVMMKAFLVDLYTAWRDTEGLEVSEPYQRY